MSIKPPIKCPPDYSINAFRLTACKKFGIVKGIDTLMDLDMTNLFVPIANYEERFITLKAGQTKKIDVSSIGEYWPMNETYEFLVETASVGLGTEHTYTLYNENLVVLETINFTVDSTYTTFDAALTNAVTNSTVIKDTVSFNFSNFDTATGTVTVGAINKSLKLRHLFSFDNTGFGGYYPFPKLTAGNLIKKYTKYEEPRLKLLLLYPDFYKSTVMAGCNCIDSSGELKSNVKWIEYAFVDEYNRINNTTSPIIVTPTADPTIWNWSQSSSDHINYYFNVGDLVQIKNSNNPNSKAAIVSIDGFTITLDSPIGDNTTSGQVLSAVYSPNSINWHKMGDLYIQTTGQELYETDYIFFESLILKNPHNYDLPIRVLLGV